MREYMKGFGIPQLPSLQQASKLAPASSAFKQAKPTQKLTPQKNSSDLLSPPAFALLARFLEAVFGQQIQEIFGFGKRSPAKTVPRTIQLGRHPGTVIAMNPKTTPKPHIEKAMSSAS